MRKKHIVFSAIALVIAGLLITSAAGFGVRITPEPETVEQTSNAREIVDMEPAFMTEKEIQKLKFERIENAELEPAQVSMKKTASMPVQGVDKAPAEMLVDNYNYEHPAIAYDGADYLVLAYELEDLNEFEEELIIEAVNYTPDPTDVYSFYYPGDNVGGKATYPTADYWGSDDRFHLAYCIQNATISNGDPMNIRIDRPGSPDNGSEISNRQWPFHNSGFQNFIQNEIACDNTVAFPTNTTDEPWGVTSWLGGSDGSQFAAGEAVPFLHYPGESGGNNRYSTISWYYLENAGGQDVMITGCEHTSAYVDPLGNNPDDIPVEGDGISISYQVYDWPGVVDVGDPVQWHLGFRWDEYEYLPDFDGVAYPPADGGLGLWTYPNQTTWHLKNPVVAAYDDTIVVVTEIYGLNEQDPADSDIMCWYTYDGNFSNADVSFIASSSNYEKNPDIQWIEGDKFQVSFEYVNATNPDDVTTYMSKTSNGGASWGLWYYFPAFDGLSIDDYRHADYSEAADIIAMEYDNNSFIDLFLGDSTIESDIEPNAPLALYPEDGATDVSPLLDEYGEYGYLIWAGGDPDGDTITYDVYLDTTSPPTTLIGSIVDDEFINMTEAGQVPLDEYTQYYWQVEAEDDDGTNTSEIFTFTTGEALTCGDANGDGVINVSDAVFVINYVFIPGSPEPDPVCIADANGDGFINVSDAVYLINYVFIPGSPAPVQPDGCPCTPPS